MAEINRHDARVIAAHQEGQHLIGAALHHTDDKPEAESHVRRTALLTGATGLIGTQILRQLLEHRDVGRVIALVRGKTAEEALHRTIDAAKKALWWSDFHGGKLEVWLADLSRPQLGLDAAHWSAFAHSKITDVVIHNGATVHFGKSYAALEAVNVSSTVELLCLAPLTYQTRFVFVTGGREWTFEGSREEDMARELSDNGPIGYEQTKFVAEALVKRAAQRSEPGLNRFAIANPGLVIGTHTEGVANADDYIWRLAAACVRVGAYNADEAEVWVRVSDAAATATIIVEAALKPRRSVRRRHVGEGRNDMGGVLGNPPRDGVPARSQVRNGVASCCSSGHGHLRGSTSTMATGV